MGGFGLLIRGRRMAAGMRQKDLAGEAGISASYLALIESGRRVPNPAMQARIAAALGLADEQLSQGLHKERVAALQGLGGVDGADLAEDADAFALQFPDWAAVLIRLENELRRAEGRVRELSDPFRHDEALAAQMHEVLSAAASISSTASILEDEAINPNWRRRFVRNIGEDAAKLQNAASVLSKWIEGDGPQDRAGVDEPGDWFARRGGVAAVLGDDWRAELDADTAVDPGMQDILRVLLSRFERDAGLLPDLEEEDDPVALASDRGLDPCVALARAAGMRGSGLVISDAAGPPWAIGMPPGFPLPGRGDPCPLWPLHHAAPGRPRRAVCAAPGPAGDAFLCTAAASERIRGGVPVLERVMLVEDAGSRKPERPIGPGCASCPVIECPARRHGRTGTG